MNNPVYYKDLPIKQRIVVDINTFFRTIHMVWGFIATLIGCFFAGYLLSLVTSPIAIVFYIICISLTIKQCSLFHTISIKQAYLFNKHIRTQTIYNEALDL